MSVWYVCERGVWGEHGVWSVGECGVWSVGGCERGL